MNDARQRPGLRLLLAVALMPLASCDFPPWTRDDAARQGGPDWSNLSLNAMVERYGAPTRVEIGRVVWEDKAPWKRIAVWDDMSLDPLMPVKDDNLEETLAYVVPLPRRRMIAEFSGHVRVSADGSELSARSFSEERNFLALNLADEVIRGVKTPEEARTFSAATLRLADAGKSSPYMKSLLFQRPPLGAARPGGTPDVE